MAADDPAADPLELLFAYGTLLPGDVRWHHLQPFVVDHGVVDRVRGHLFDTGLDYPAARFHPAPDEVVHGRVFTLLADRIAAALDHLDAVEGAVDGAYQRVAVTTVAGRRAWAYQVGGGLELEPIPGGSWPAHRARLAGG